MSFKNERIVQFFLITECFIVMEYVTKEDHKEDLKTDRRVTRAEADIVHTNANVKAIDTDVQNHKVQYRTEFRFIAVLLVSITIGLFYFIHHVNMEMQRQFGDMSLQFGELRSDVADNRRLIEANSTQLVSLRSEVEETNKRIDEVNDRIDGMSNRIDEVNDRLDNVDDRLAVVENVLSIDHQTSAYYKTGKL